MDREKECPQQRELWRIPKEVTMTVKKLQYPLANVDAEPAITKNMSNRGICFVTAKPFEPGTLLSIEIDLRGWQHYLQNVFSILDAATITKPLTAISEVSWSKKLPDGRGYEVGARFKDIYVDDFQAFQKYLTKITEK